MYTSKLSLMETELAIKFIKDEFEKKLAKKLNLIRISAPLIVSRKSGINDYLNGYEKPVSFIYQDEMIEIVQSLAKWKRMALKVYGFNNGHGLYTDMNAIRQDESVDFHHSLYVDQWDWEKIIESKNRTNKYLFKIVNDIYDVILNIEKAVNKQYPVLENKLPEKIVIIDSQMLEDQYPKLTTRQRERVIVKQHKAVFIHRIGSLLKSGQPHDGRSPDYDDWKLNGDIIFYDSVNDQALEISSMGIRVDNHSLLNQLKEKDALDRLSYPYHQAIINSKLPLTIGGGIGQSRLCQFFLEKKHIGEVQSSYWPEKMLAELINQGIKVL
jgi:aspartate--ammonia ligase